MPRQFMNQKPESRGRLQIKSSFGFVAQAWALDTFFSKAPLRGALGGVVPIAE